MDESHSRDFAQREASAAHATLQWALYALPPRHPARLMLMLATARADRDRQASLQSAEEDARPTGSTVEGRRPVLAPR